MQGPAGFRSQSIFDTEAFIYFAICNIYLAARFFKHLVLFSYDLLSLTILLE
jgi:hypothetical protein